MAEMDSIADLKAALGNRQRLLGIDPGTKTLGLALSDFLCMVATPMETIKRTKFSKDMIHMKRVIEEQNVGGLVIGLPKNMDGSEGPRCQSVRQFAENVMAEIDIPFVFWDERLSTAGVQRTLIEADVSRAKRAGVIDKMAASFILQGVLDAMS